MNLIKVNLVFFFSLFSSALLSQTELWEVHNEAQKLKNPYVVDSNFVAKGKKLYIKNCIVCHGKKGLGNGVAATGLIPTPSNFTSDTYQKQAEGTSFYKLSKGKGVMAAYENILTEEERWALVEYLKRFKKKELTIKNTTKERTFKFTQLINAQSTEVLPKGSSEFTIQHRFGAFQLNHSAIESFAGLDLTANIRFAYAKAISNNLMVEVGRTKHYKTYDIGLKFAIIRQYINQKFPVNISFYSNTSIATEKFSAIDNGSTFEDGSNFEYKNIHRITYNNQVIFSKKLTNYLSLNIATAFVWRNLVNPNKGNLEILIPINAYFKASGKSAFITEIQPKLKTSYKNTPASVAYQFSSTGAHCFTLLVSNSSYVLTQNITSNAVYDFRDNYILIGFNIKRIF
mgnify:CR=1 FL=1